MSGFPLLPLVAGKFHFECLQDRGAGFPPFFHSCWPFLRQWGRRIPWLSLEVNGIYFLWDRVSHCTVWSCVSQQGLVIMCIHMQWRVILRAFSQASRVACGQELASRGCLLLCLGFPQILNYHTGTYSAFRNLIPPCLLFLFFWEHNLYDPWLWTMFSDSTSHIAQVQNLVSCSQRVQKLK